MRLYRVGISQAALWPDYRGAPDDVLELEVYEHWVELPTGLPVIGVSTARSP